MSLDDYDESYLTQEYTEFKKLTPKKLNDQSVWSTPSHQQTNRSIRFPNERNLFSSEKRVPATKRDRRQLGKQCS